MITMHGGDIGGDSPELASEHRHSVQFYDDDAYLLQRVSTFLAAGLEANQSVLVIATPEHRDVLIKRLGLLMDTPSSLERVTVADAEETLARFMVRDVPDALLFGEVFDEFAAEWRKASSAPTHVRAYGEMVDVLWRRGNVDGAIRLEALWGDVTRRLPVTLLCSYFMGNFYKDANPLQFLKICQAHDHVVPTERFVQLANPAERLREVTLLQHRARTLEKEISERKDLESALRLALRERSQIAEELRESLAREKDARARADASDAFKEIFLAILGHDFRNPLTTILTTARLMMMRAEVNPDTQKRLGRVLSSGLRMERMVEQLVDITRIRLAGGLPIHPLPNQDLVVLIAKNVDELRASAPAVPIVLHSPDTCFWRVDPERFEQVVANLVDNAVAHGDRSSPINVTLAVSKGAVSLSVQNCGVPISAELMHILFNPFARSTQRPIGSGGLGLGLYISDQIVAAHGGTLEVESTTGGTLFEVQLPQ